MTLATTELHYLEGPYGKHRIGHDAGRSWSAIVEAIREMFECEEEDVHCLEADSDEGRDFDQVTVNGKPVANIIGTTYHHEADQHSHMPMAAE